MVKFTTNKVVNTFFGANSGKFYHIDVPPFAGLTALVVYCVTQLVWPSTKLPAQASVESCTCRPYTHTRMQRIFARAMGWPDGAGNMQESQVLLAADNGEAGDSNHGQLTSLTEEDARPCVRFLATVPEC